MLLKDNIQQLLTMMLTPGPRSTTQVISKWYNIGYACGTFDVHVHDLIKKKYDIEFVFCYKHNVTANGSSVYGNLTSVSKATERTSSWLFPKNCWQAAYNISWFWPWIFTCKWNYFSYNMTAYNAIWLTQYCVRHSLCNLERINCKGNSPQSTGQWIITVQLQLLTCHFSWPALTDKSRDFLTQIRFFNHLKTHL